VKVMVPLCAKEAELKSEPMVRAMAARVVLVFMSGYLGVIRLELLV